MSNLQRELKDLGRQAMVDLLKSFGPNISPGERKMLSTLQKEEPNATNWVADRFQARFATRRFLKRLLWTRFEFIPRSYSLFFYI